jgi:hypothetical protein
MVAFIVMGIVTREKVISAAALAIIGACWVASSLCLTIASIERNDDWDAISGKYWHNVLSLFAIGSGLLFGKWMAAHN